MDNLLEQGIAAYKAGKRDEARKIFTALVKQEPDNERAWGWMYQVSNDDQEKIHCMKQALRINPANAKASQILDSLTAQDFPFEQPAPSPTPSPQSVINKNEKRVNKETAPKSNKNLIQMLLAGILFFFSLAVCIVVTFWVFSQRNPSTTSAISPSIISTPTDSPEKIYVEKMSKNMVLLDSFNNTLAKWDKMMITVIPGQRDLTYGQSLQILPTAIRSWQAMSQVGMTYEVEPYIKVTQTNVTPVAQEISSEGFALLTAWHSVTPPPELKLPHEQIESCVQYKIDLANDIINLLQQYIIPTRELGADPCGNFMNSVSAINTYLSNYGK